MAKQQILRGMKNKSSVANLVRLLTDIVLIFCILYISSQTELICHQPIFHSKTIFVCSPSKLKSRLAFPFSLAPSGFSIGTLTKGHRGLEKTRFTENITSLLLQPDNLFLKYQSAVD